MATSTQRAKRQISRSHGHLVVVGTSKTGFRLAGATYGKTVSFGKLHKRQKDAKQSGLAKFGKTAKAKKMVEKDLELLLQS